MNIRRLPTRRKGKRSGATAIEVALVMPVFLVFLFLLIEYGHYLWVNNMLTAAVRNGARLGCTEGATNEDVDTYIRNFLRGSVDSEAVDILVKDASVFDSGEDKPVTSSDYSDLPNIELSTMDSRELFVIRAEVNFGDVAFLNFPGVDRIDMHGKSIMRHE